MSISGLIMAFEMSRRQVSMHKWFKLDQLALVCAIKTFLVLLADNSLCSIDFENLVVHNPSYRVNLLNIGSARVLGAQ